MRHDVVKILFNIIEHDFKSQEKMHWVLRLLMPFLAYHDILHFRSVSKMIIWKFEREMAHGSFLVE